MTLDRSPEFLFKTSYLYLSIKTDFALDEPLAGPFLSPELLLEQIYIWFTVDIRDLDLVVSNQEILYVSIYKSM